MGEAISPAPALSQAFACFSTLFLLESMATVTISSRSAALAAAAESRLPANKPASAGVLYKNYDEGHTRRQELRKMIDRGILERNALEVALRALKVRDLQLVPAIGRRSKVDHV